MSGLKTNAGSVSQFNNIVSRNSDMAIALGLVAILIVMVLPLPRFCLDILLSLSICLSVVLLLVSVYVQKAVEFSVFPSLLLITTLFRLSLNVASTRLILLHGSDNGVDAAGQVIKSFGDFLVGGNYAVGLILFTILVVINFIVITKGAGRVAEVAARFTLDALPGKQMSIDADLNAGNIDEVEARRRRLEIARESDFYGAMDGASKFVRGDAIAGILILAVNIIGGIIIGTIQHGKSLEEAASVYTLLTVGDGLVTQIPALIVSTAAGIIVTRSASGQNLGAEFTSQLLLHPKAIGVAGVVMFLLAIIPGLPHVPFLLLAAGAGALSYRMTKKQTEAETQIETVTDTETESEAINKLLTVAALEIEVGHGLLKLVDEDQGGELLARIMQIRKQFALSMGVIIPSVQIRDNMDLKSGEYVIQLKGVQIGQGELKVGQLLAIDPGHVREKIVGTPTFEPAFGLSAIWIAPKYKEQAEDAGYTVVDLSTVISTHLTELIRKNSSEILGRQELQNLIDVVKLNHPKVVEELIPDLLPVSVILKVCQSLLKENVSIRDLRSILETLADHASQIKDPAILTEYVRAVLGRSITKKLINTQGELPLLTLERHVEEKIAQGIVQTDRGKQLALDPAFVQSLVRELGAEADRMIVKNAQAVLLVSPGIRSHLKQLLDKYIPHIVVLSHNEIAPSISIKSFATVRLSHAS